MYKIISLFQNAFIFMNIGSLHLNL